MILRYDSTAALRQAYLACDSRKRLGNHLSSADDWHNDESEADSLRKAELGDTSLVPFAEKELDKLDQVIETPRRVWDRSPAGAFCIVPDYLSGLPTPMRRQVHVNDEMAPITIFACTTSSAGISAKTLERRGVIILALVMALSRIRPVSLQQLAIMHGRDAGETIITSEINTSPLDLATACYVLTSAGFARRLTYGLGWGLNGFNGGWPRSYGYDSNGAEYYERLRNILSNDPKRTLVIKAAQLNDELLQQPTVWINKQITKFTQEQEDFVQ